MGLIALVVGYLYRFRWRAHALAVTVAVLLGYVVEFVRLDAPVLYYLVALRIPSLQPRGEMADYIIGGTLFAIAVFCLLTAVEKLRQRMPGSIIASPAAEDGGESLSIAGPLTPGEWSGRPFGPASTSVPRVRVVLWGMR